MLNFPEISKFSDDFQSNFLNSDIILTEFWSFKDSNYSIGRQPNLSTLAGAAGAEGAAGAAAKRAEPSRALARASTASG